MIAEADRKPSLASYYKQHPNGLSTYYKNLFKEITFLNKHKVLMHYSNPRGHAICNNCGEQDIAVLCLDHINNDGYKHRKGLKMRAGSAFYQWIIKNDYPSGFQVLCFNCNMRKAIHCRLRNGNIIK